MKSTIRINDVFDIYAQLPWIKIEVNNVTVVDQDNVMSINELEEDVSTFLEQYGDKEVIRVDTRVVSIHHFIINFILAEEKEEVYEL